MRYRPVAAESRSSRVQMLLRRVHSSTQPGDSHETVGLDREQTRDGPSNSGFSAAFRGFSSRPASRLRIPLWLIVDNEQLILRLATLGPRDECCSSRTTQTRGSPQTNESQASLHCSQKNIAEK